MVDLTKGPAPTSTFSRGPNFHPRGLYHVAHGGHTLKTALEGCILEFTYITGPAHSLVTDHGRDFYPGNQRPMAHGELTRGKAYGGHILLGNHEITRTNGSMPITSFYPVQTRRARKLDHTVEPCPGQRLRC